MCVADLYNLVYCLFTVGSVVLYALSGLRSVLMIIKARSVVIAIF